MPRVPRKALQGTDTYNVECHDIVVNVERSVGVEDFLGSLAVSPALGSVETDPS